MFNLISVLDTMLNTIHKQTNKRNKTLSWSIPKMDVRAGSLWLGTAHEPPHQMPNTPN